MTSTARTLLSIAVIASTLAATVAWSLSFYIDSESDYKQAAADWKSVAVSARTIAAARPAIAAGASGENLAGVLSRRLDEAMKTAAIDAEDLVRVTPQPRRRIGDGNLQEVPTQLAFQQVTLRQVLSLVSTLTPAGSGLTLQELHLSFPNDTVGNPPANEWNAEVTVSYTSDQPAADTVRAGSGE